MAYDKTTLRSIFRRTDGRCHLCHRRVTLKHYGFAGKAGAWHVEHSRPRANGGTDHGNNLYAAHIDCNLRKGVKSTRSTRAVHGKQRAPYSAKKKRAVRAENAATGLLGGALTGGVIGGPPGALIGALIGGLIGTERSVV